MRNHANFAKFRAKWSNRCRDIMILIFQDGGQRHLEFFYFKFVKA